MCVRNSRYHFHGPNGAMICVSDASTCCVPRAPQVCCGLIDVITSEEDHADAVESLCNRARCTQACEAQGVALQSHVSCHVTAALQLRREFEQFGRIKSMRMVADEDGKPRGWVVPGARRTVSESWPHKAWSLPARWSCYMISSFRGGDIGRIVLLAPQALYFLMKSRWSVCSCQCQEYSFFNPTKLNRNGVDLM